MANEYQITLSDGNTLATLYPLEVNGPNNRSTTRQILEALPAYTITQIGAITPHGFVKITGDWTTRFKTGYPVSIINSPANDGSYTVFADSVYDSGQNETTIELTTALPSSTSGGKIRLPFFVAGGDLTNRFINGFEFTVNKEFRYSAGAGQTTFNADYQVGSVVVWKNGVQLTNGVDYAATTGTTVVLTTPATSNDSIEIFGQREYTVNASYIGETSGSANVVKTTLIRTTPAPNNSTIPFGLIQYQINPPNTLDANTTLKLPGKGVMNYGEAIVEDLVHLLENFSSPVEPNLNPDIGYDPYGAPIRGQLWHWWDNTGGHYNEAFQRYSVATEYAGWTKDWDVDTGKLILRDPQNSNKESSGRDADVYLKGNDNDVGLRIHLSVNPDPQDNIVRITNQQDNIEYLRVEYGIAGNPGFIESANGLHISTLPQNDAEIHLNAPADRYSVFRWQTQGATYGQQYVFDGELPEQILRLDATNVTWDIGSTNVVGGSGNVLFNIKGNYTTNVGYDGAGNYALDINGTSLTDVLGDVTEIYRANQTTTVTDAVTTNIGDDYNLNVGTDGTGNLAVDINGTSTTDVLGNVQETYRASQTTNVTTNITETAGGNYSQTITGTSTVDVTGLVTEIYRASQSTTVTGTVTTNISDDYNLNVGTDGTGNLAVDINGTSTTDVLGAVTETYQSTQTTTVTGNVTENYQTNVDTNITGNNDVDVGGTNAITSVGTSVYETNGASAHLTVQTLNNTSDIFIDSARDIVIDAASDVLVTAGTSINFDNNTLFIDTANNRVGILNGAPTYEFDVNGDTRFTQPVGINNPPPSGSPVWLEVTGDVQVNSQIRGSNQTAASPTYSFTNDLDTGTFLVTPGTIGTSINGHHTFTYDSNSLTISGTASSTLSLIEEEGAVNEKKWTITADEETLQFRLYQDNFTTFTSPVTYIRTGTTLDEVRTYAGELALIGDNSYYSVSQGSFPYTGVQPIGAQFGAWLGGSPLYAHAAGTKYHRWLGAGTDFDVLYAGQAADGFGGYDYVIRADRLSAFGDATTNVLVIKPQTQRVGIGTTFPDTILHVSHSNDVVAKFESTDAIAAVQLKDPAGTAEITTAVGGLFVNPNIVTKPGYDNGVWFAHGDGTNGTRVQINGTSGEDLIARLSFENTTPANNTFWAFNYASPTYSSPEYMYLTYFNGTSYTASYTFSPTGIVTLYGAVNGYYFTDRTSSVVNALYADGGSTRIWSNSDNSDKLIINNTSGVVSVTAANYETLITNPNDIPNKKYVDDKMFSSSWREPVKVIDTSDYPNVGSFPTGSPVTVDGVTISTGDRVLFSGSSTDISIRDIYVWNGSTWVKDQDAVPPGQTRSVGDVVYIQDGTKAGKVYAFDINDEWSLISGAGGGANVVREQHTATLGQTSFTLANQYRPTSTGSLLLVFVNGQKQTKDLFYTETDPQTVSIVAPSPLLAGDIVEFYIFEQVTTEAAKFNRETQTGLTGTPVINFSLISYVVGSDNLFVYFNGQKVIKDTDYTETSSTSITWTGVSLTATDVIEAYSQVPVVAGTLLEDIENVGNSPSDGDVLVYNGTSGIWEPQTYSSKPKYKQHVGVTGAGPFATPGLGGSNVNGGDGTLQVFINGVLQMEGIDYTAGSGNITLITAPPVAFNLVIYEFGS